MNNLEKNITDGNELIEEVINEQNLKDSLLRYKLTYEQRKKIEDPINGKVEKQEEELEQ